MINDQHGQNDYSVDFSETEYLPEQIRVALSSTDPAKRTYMLSTIIARYDELMRYLSENPLDKLLVEGKAISTIRNIFSFCVGLTAPFIAFSSAAAEKEYTDLAVANYLMLCLESNKDAVQTLKSFIKHGRKYITYSNKTYLPSLPREEILESDLAAIKYAYEKWVELVSAYQEEAKRKSYPVPLLPKKINNNKNSERPIRFSDLCFCDLYSQGRLSLYHELIDQNRSSFGDGKESKITKDTNGKVKVGRRKTSFATIKNSIAAHNCIYSETKGTAESDPQRYVATCAFFLKYEEAFQFTTIGKMVQHYCERIELSPSGDTDDFRLACFCALYVAFICPITHYISLRTVNDVTLDRDINNIIDMVFSCKEEIELNHIPQDRVETMDPKSVLNQFSPELYGICETHHRDRTLFTHAFHLLLSLYSPKRLANIQWDSDAFSYVARFFKSEYPLIENYTDIDLGLDCLSNPAYNLFIEHYDYGKKSDKNPIVILQNYICEYRENKKNKPTDS